MLAAKLSAVKATSLLFLAGYYSEQLFLHRRKQGVFLGRHWTLDFFEGKECLTGKENRQTLLRVE